MYSETKGTWSLLMARLVTGIERRFAWSFSCFAPRKPMRAANSRASRRLLRTTLCSPRDEGLHRRVTIPNSRSIR